MTDTYVYGGPCQICGCRHPAGDPCPGATSIVQGNSSESPALQPPVEWHPLQEVIDLLKAQTDGRWHWGLDMPLKYLEVRIDVRDGNCIIRDRDGNRVSIQRIRAAAAMQAATRQEGAE